MKFSISHPKLGTSIQYEIIEEKDYAHFYGKKLGDLIDADSINPLWQGFVLKIVGGSLKSGTPMKQGVLAEGRRKLLLTSSQSSKTNRNHHQVGFRASRNHYRPGVRLRRSIAGCVVNHEVAVLNLIVVKKNIISNDDASNQEIEGLTNTSKAIVKGPKRASKIIKLFSLQITDNVKNHVVPRKLVLAKSAKSKQSDAENKQKILIKKPKVMRLIDSKKRYNKKKALEKLYAQIKAKKSAKEEYDKLLRQLHAKKESSKSLSTTSIGTSNSRILLKSRISSDVIKLD